MDEDDPANGSSGGVQWEDGLPTRSVNQSCALCGADRPKWLHPLHPDRVDYQVDGDNYSLPTFWCLCDRCEKFYHRGQDADLIDFMAEESSPWSWATEPGLIEHAFLPLAVFRRADLGARALAE